MVQHHMVQKGAIKWCIWCIWCKGGAMTKDEFKATQKSRGWTLKQTAEHLDVPPGRVKNYQLGRTAIPEDIAYKMSQAHANALEDYEALIDENEAPRATPKTGLANENEKLLQQIQSLQRENKAQRDTIEAQATTIEKMKEAPSKNITFEEYCDMEEDLVRRSEWQLNSWARHKSSGDWVDSPVNINGVEYPALPAPAPYRLKGESEMVPADQRPEGSWMPA